MGAADHGADARGLGAILGQLRGEGDVTENQRRTEDLLRPRDLIVRAATAIGLIVAALAALLALLPS